MLVERVADIAGLGVALAAGRPPRMAPPGAPTGPGRFRHHDWSAFVLRFAGAEGVDYRTFARVQRLLREYLSRLSDVDPDEFDFADEQLAFYLNAYNALAVFQVLRHYPVVSPRDVPAAFTRPFPVGRENLSLHELLHAKIRAFGDPRVHAAVAPAAASAPRLRAYTAENLQTELDEQMRSLLADPRRGLRLLADRNSVALSATIVDYAGDFAAAGGAPTLRSTLRGRLQPGSALPYLRRFLPEQTAAAIHGTPRIERLPYDWRLNEA
jgi:hypothetical protein